MQQLVHNVCAGIENWLTNLVSTEPHGHGFVVGRVRATTSRVDATKLISVVFDPLDRKLLDQVFRLSLAKRRHVHERVWKKRNVSTVCTGGPVHFSCPTLCFKKSILTICFWVVEAFEGDTLADDDNIAQLLRQLVRLFVWSRRQLVANLKVMKTLQLLQQNVEKWLLLLVTHRFVFNSFQLGSLVLVRHIIVVGVGRKSFGLQQTRNNE